MKLSHIAVLIILSNITVGNSFQLTQNGTSGCGKESPWKKTEKLEIFTMGVDDGTNWVERQIGIHIPGSYDINLPAPILYYFHGQNVDAFNNGTNWYEIADKHGVILVFPKGMSDFGDKHDMSTWNVGLVDDHTDQGMAKANQACFFGTQNQCYDTCKHICSQCNWGTCFDDG